MEFIGWLRAEIASKKLRLVVLDSYTAMRAVRTGTDIVKAEQIDMRLLDSLAKETGCAVLIVHHDSKTSEGQQWALKGAGTFAMTGATEALIHVTRFTDELADNALARRLCGGGRR